MTHEHDRSEANVGHETYEIRVRGHLPPDWSDWFSGLTVAHDPNGDTILRGTLPDQAALHGILTRIRDLGIPLIGVTQGSDGSVSA